MVRGSASGRAAAGRRGAAAISALPTGAGHVTASSSDEVREWDLTDPEELETWLAEALRDWELQQGVATLTALLVILGQLLDQARTKRELVKNDLRQEGYLEGQINILETVIENVKKAVAARESKIGLKRGGR